jgi:hypothetical protein
LFYRFILEDFQRVCNKAPKTEPKTEKQQKLDFFILVRYNIPTKLYIPPYPERRREQAL